MEKFAYHCRDMRPNVTYLAIGCAYNATSGPQQHPPFLTNLIKAYSELNFQIILVDPNMEDPPEIVTYFGLRNIDNGEWYGKDNINVHIIRELFDFVGFMEETKESAENGSCNGLLPVNYFAKMPSFNSSKKLIVELVERTINAKIHSPKNTYLFFMHDFSGNKNSLLSDHFWKIYQKREEKIRNIYRKNIMIDLNCRIENCCFPDMNTIFFGPKLIQSSHGALEIFNPFLLEEFDIYTIILQKYNDTTYKQLVWHAIKTRLREFSVTILSAYRQLYIVLKNNTEIILNEIPADLLEGIDTQLIHRILSGETNNEETNTNNIILYQITQNLFACLYGITGFTAFFRKIDLWNKIFSEFVDKCTEKNIDPYRLIDIFQNCLKKLENFIFFAEPSQYLEELEDNTITYIKQNHQLPLYQLLYFLDTNSSQKSSNSIIIDI